jgi:hypothetical protein
MAVDGGAAPRAHPAALAGRIRAVSEPVTVEEYRAALAGLPPGHPVRQAGAAAVESALRALPRARHGAALVADGLQAQIWLAFAEGSYWQPARVLVGKGLSRSRGFPETAPDFIRMRDWCVARCRGRWAVETRTAGLQGWAEGGVTFWFERPEEGHRFALKWLPMKCT